MSDQKATLIRWFEEVWNQGRRETIDELLPEDCVIHDGNTDTGDPANLKFSSTAFRLLSQTRA